MSPSPRPSILARATATMAVAAVVLACCAACCAALNPMRGFALTSGSDPMSRELAGPYTRIWIPECRTAHLLHGHWRTGDRVQSTFTLNNNYVEFNGIDANAWLPWECRCSVKHNGVGPTFDGCFAGADAAALTRTGADATMIEGAEIFVCTDVKLEVLRAAQDPTEVHDRGLDFYMAFDGNPEAVPNDARFGDGGSTPVVSVEYRIYSYTYAQQLAWQYDMRNLPCNSPAVVTTPQIAMLQCYFMDFVVNPVTLLDNVPAIQPYFAADATYEVLLHAWRASACIVRFLGADRIACPRLSWCFPARHR